MLSRGQHYFDCSWAALLFQYDSQQHLFLYVVCALNTLNESNHNFNNSTSTWLPCNRLFRRPLCAYLAFKIYSVFSFYYVYVKLPFSFLCFTDAIFITFLLLLITYLSAASPSTCISIFAWSSELLDLQLAYQLMTVVNKIRVCSIAFFHFG